MKLPRAVLFIIAVALSGRCTNHGPQNPDSGCPKNSTCSYWFADANSNISIPGFPTIPPNKNLFVYEITFKDDPQIADDELFEHITFEVSMDVNEFNLTQLDNAEVLYGRLCFCPVQGPTKITEGHIQGTKISDSEWRLTAAFTFSLYGQPKTYTINSQRLVKR